MSVSPVRIRRASVLVVWHRRRIAYEVEVVSAPHLPSQGIQESALVSSEVVVVHESVLFVAVLFAGAVRLAHALGFRYGDGRRFTMMFPPSMLTKK